MPVVSTPAPGAEIIEEGGRLLCVARVPCCPPISDCEALAGAIAGQRYEEPNRVLVPDGPPELRRRGPHRELVYPLMLASAEHPPRPPFSALVAPTGALHPEVQKLDQDERIELFRTDVLPCLLALLGRGPRAFSELSAACFIRIGDQPGRFAVLHPALGGGLAPGAVCGQRRRAGEWTRSDLDTALDLFALLCRDPDLRTLFAAAVVEPTRRRLEQKPFDGADVARVEMETVETYERRCRELRAMTSDDLGSSLELLNEASAVARWLAISMPEPPHLFDGELTPPCLGAYRQEIVGRTGPFQPGNELARLAPDLSDRGVDEVGRLARAADTALRFDVPYPADRMLERIKNDQPRRGWNAPGLLYDAAWDGVQLAACGLLQEYLHLHGAPDAALNAELRSKLASSLVSARSWLLSLRLLAQRYRQGGWHSEVPHLVNLGNEDYLDELMTVVDALDEYRRMRRLSTAATDLNRRIDAFAAGKNPIFRLFPLYGRIRLAQARHFVYLRANPVGSSTATAQWYLSDVCTLAPGRSHRGQLPSELLLDTQPGFRPEPGSIATWYQAPSGPTVVHLAPFFVLLAPPAVDSGTEPKVVYAYCGCAAGRLLYRRLAPVGQSGLVNPDLGEFETWRALRPSEVPRQAALEELVGV